MPRTARYNNPNGLYHIICNSIPELDLFRNSLDKEKYFSVLRKYKSQYGFKILSIALMDTHIHMLVDVCGANISSIMQSINVSYVQYYNRKYSRKGGLFLDRFKSIPIESTTHLYDASLYIHLNPCDIPRWKSKIDKYPYSSLGYFLGISDKNADLFDIDIVMRLFGGKVNSARKVYARKISSSRKIDYEVTYMRKNEKKSEYRSERLVNNLSLSPETLVSLLGKNLGIGAKELFSKHSKTASPAKAICVFLMRKYCGYSLREISAYFGNITQSGISYLCNLGYNAISDSVFKKLITQIKTICMEPCPL